MPVCFDSSCTALVVDARPAGAAASQVASHVQRRLQESSYTPVRNVSVEQHGGSVTLFGCVPNFYLKQVAQSIAGKVDGVQSVVNRIEVIEGFEYF